MPIPQQCARRKRCAPVTALRGSGLDRMPEGGKEGGGGASCRRSPPFFLVARVAAHRSPPPPIASVFFSLPSFSLPLTPPPPKSSASFKKRRRLPPPRRSLRRSDGRVRHGVLQPLPAQLLPVRPLGLCQRGGAPAYNRLWRRRLRDPRSAPLVLGAWLDHRAGRLRGARARRVRCGAVQGLVNTGFTLYHFLQYAPRFAPTVALSNAAR